MSDRIDTKRAVSVLLSELGVLGKVPEGTSDRLTALALSGSLPDFFSVAVDRPPPKGSAAWRHSRDYAMYGKVPRRRKSPPNAPRASESLPWEVDGNVLVRLSPAFIQELFTAGREMMEIVRDMYGPYSMDDVLFVKRMANDVAQGMCQLTGVAHTLAVSQLSARHVVAGARDYREDWAPLEERQCVICRNEGPSHPDRPHVMEGQE